MARESIIQFYTTDEYEEWLSEQAEAADKSLSEYCHEVVEQHITQEQDDQQYRRYGVDQQIELALDELRDETSTLLSEFQSETGTRLEHIQRLRTIYVMAIWRLLRENFAPSEQESALKSALEHVGRDLSADPEIRRLLTSEQAKTVESGAEQTEAPPAGTTRGDSE